VLTSRILLPAAQYPDGAAIARTFARIRDEAARIPGVGLAALGAVVPLSGSSMNSSVRAEGTSGPETAHTADLRLVSPDYFAVMSIPRRAGRDLTLRDDATSPKVVMINEALAHKLWPGQPLGAILGRRIDAVSNKRNESEFREVVGIVGDLHDAALTKTVDPEFYIPIPQTPEALWPFLARSLVVVVKAANPSINPATLKKPLQQAVARVDRSLPLADAVTMSDYVRASLATARFNTILLSALGAIALALAMVGVYGVVSYFVTQRTQEIGIRMALGATPTHIWRHVVRRGLSPIVVGVVMGFALSMFTVGVLRSQLFGVQPTDPATFGGVGALLLAVSLVATYVPARRAMRVAPVVALNAT
jgi:putative ABC transport system permease protein